MKRFWAKLLLLLCPWLAYAALVFLVDPYDLFRHSPVVSDRIKSETSAKLDPAMWKLHLFDQAPCNKVLLGDSRMERLSVTDIRQIAKQNYCNMAISGASLKEVMDAFWYVDSRVKLDSVVMGVNFNTYNASYNRDRIVLSRSVRHNPLLYLANRTVAEAAFYNLYASISGRNPNLGVPEMSREAFWKVELGPITDQFYARYSYPSEYRSELLRIAEHCREAHIKLTFVVLPGHIELQDRVNAYGLQAQYASFKSDLASIGNTIDFDFPNAITVDRNNYLDPYHFTDAVSIEIIHDLWDAAPRYGHVLQ